MTTNTIGFIGSGNMATALARGIIAKGTQSSRLWMSDLDQAKLSTLKTALKVHTTSDNIELVEHCDVIVLAVKPQVMQQVCASIKGIAQKRQALVISIAAGITITSLQEWLGELPIVRTMPNLPAQVQTGATALYANDRVNDSLKNISTKILSTVGIAHWVENESILDAVTALSGSGPAYFFLIMEIMMDAGKKLGLSEELAKTFTLQTALGAAQMAITSDESAADLRISVTSPGGTTAAALDVFKLADIKQTFERALVAARDRAKELSA